MVTSMYRDDHYEHSWTGRRLTLPPIESSNGERSPDGSSTTANEGRFKADMQRLVNDERVANISKDARMTTPSFVPEAVSVSEPRTGSSSRRVVSTPLPISSSSNFPFTFVAPVTTTSSSSSTSVAEPNCWTLGHGHSTRRTSLPPRLHSTMTTSNMSSEINRRASSTTFEHLEPQMFTKLYETLIHKWSDQIQTSIHQKRTVSLTNSVCQSPTIREDDSEEEEGHQVGDTSGDSISVTDEKNQENQVPSVATKRPRHRSDRDNLIEVCHTPIRADQHQRRRSSVPGSTIGHQGFAESNVRGRSGSSSSSTMAAYSNESCSSSDIATLRRTRSPQPALRRSTRKRRLSERARLTPASLSFDKEQQQQQQKIDRLEQHESINDAVAQPAQQRRTSANSQGLCNVISSFQQVLHCRVESWRLLGEHQQQQQSRQ
ncbi:hypothetical protein OIO90_005820 [Microbotryomycetes sp. JL221]|nr:hypothetical protein OIO90_005820 [Microbotryomycetes sp. JL221]